MYKVSVFASEHSFSVPKINRILVAEVLEMYQTCKLFRRAFIFLLVFIIFSLFPVLGVAAAAPGGNVSDEASLLTALGASANGDGSGTITLSDDIELSAQILINGGTFTIDGSGHTILAKGQGSDFGNALLKITGGSVTLKNVTLEVNCTNKNEVPANAFRVIHIEGSSSYLFIEDGAIITGGFDYTRTNTLFAGGVYIVNGPTVTMSGGEIKNSKTATGSTNGVCLGRLDGTVTDMSTFIMTGGKISGNSNAIQLYSGYSLVQMSGGELSGNGNGMQFQLPSINGGTIGTLELFGAPIIKDNTAGGVRIRPQTTSGAFFNNIFLTGPLTQGAHIDISPHNPNGSNGYELWPVGQYNPRLVAKGKSYTITQSDMECFHSFRPELAVITFDGKDGNIYLANYMRTYVRNGTAVSGSAAGSDTAGNGTYAYPYATIEKAYELIMNNGEICVLSDLDFAIAASFGTAKNVTVTSYADASSRAVSPWKLTRTHDDGQFKISAGEVVLTNITFDGGTIWSGGTDIRLGRGTSSSVIRTSTFICVSGGILNMDNGFTLQNHKSDSANTTADKNGSALSISGVTSTALLKSGAKIINNAHIGSGSAVSVSGGGTLYIEDGKIYGNASLNLSGAIYLDNAVLRITGCEIRNNLSGSYGAINLLSGSTLSIGGDANIHDNYLGTNITNVYIANNNAITLSASLASNAEIGVTPQTWPSHGTNIPVAQETSYHRVDSNDENFFIPDMYADSINVLSYSGKIYFASLGNPPDNGNNTSGDGNNTSGGGSNSFSGGSNTSGGGNSSIIITDTENGKITAPENPSNSDKITVKVGDVSGLLNTVDHAAYVVGKPNNLFAPSANLTRAEAVQLFFNLLLNKKSIGAAKKFPDVADDAWYAKAVNTLSAINIINGFPGGNFCPDKFITRAEFVVIAVRFSKVSLGNIIFSDVPQTHWAYNYINTAANFGWISGLGNGKFEPVREITRAEAVTLVNNMLHRYPDKEYIDSHTELNGFTDLNKSHWAYYNIIEAATAHEYEHNGGAEIWRLSPS